MSVTLEKFDERHVNYWTWKDTGKIIGFHGSSEAVANPLIERSVHNSELGKGFYCFVEPKSAFKHRGRNIRSVINMYLIDTDKMYYDKIGLIGMTLTDVLFYGNIGEYTDDLFKYCSGVSIFTRQAGGQYFTKYQQVIDNYYQFIGAYKIQDIYTIFSFDSGTKTVSLCDKEAFTNISKFKKRLIRGLVLAGICDDANAKANVDSIPSGLLEARLKEIKEIYNHLMMV